MNRLQEFDIALNMPFTGDIYDDTGHVVLPSGHVFKTYSERKAWVSHGIFVGTPEVSSIDTTEPYDIIRGVHDELKRLFGEIDSIDDFEKRVRDCAALLFSVVESDYEKSCGWIVLESPVRHALLRSLHSAIIGTRIFMSMGRTKEETISFICAALTMNISILDDQDKWDRENVIISMSQRMQIINHPRKSVDMLVKKGVADELWLDTVLNHHEEKDGKGYPNAVSGDSISLSASVLHLCDIYVAAISGRADRKGKKPEQAIKDILVSQIGKFIPELVRALLKECGHFPIGTYVQLSNGKTGVVISRDSDNSTVHVIEDRDVVEISKNGNISIVRSLGSEEVSKHLSPHEIWL